MLYGASREGLGSESISNTTRYSLSYFFSQPCSLGALWLDCMHACGQKSSFAEFWNSCSCVCPSVKVPVLQIRRNIKNSLFYPITLERRRGTTDEFATIPFHLDLFSDALVELAKFIPVHSLILSSHLFFCLPLLLFPFTVPCRIVVAKPEDLGTWPNHLSFRFLTRVRSSSYSPMAAWIFLRTSCYQE